MLRFIDLYYAKLNMLRLELKRLHEEMKKGNYYPEALEELNTRISELENDIERVSGMKVD